MKRTMLLVILAGLALGSPAAAAPPTPDPPPGAKSWTWDKSTYHYDTPSVDGKARYRCYVPFEGRRRCSRFRTVHLYGDSIHLGWGFGRYAHESFLGRIDLIATSLVKAADRREVRFRRAGNQAPRRICRDDNLGRIRSGDRVVFEDAGPYIPKADARRRWLEAVAYCARRAAARLDLTTMFDYTPGLELSAYDEPMPDASGLTANDIARQVAAARGTGLVDWNARMDAARAVFEPMGVALVHPDGIHPTPFGNVLLAASLVAREGIRFPNLDPIVAEVMARHDELVRLGMAPPFTEAQARTWVGGLIHFGRGR